MCPICGTLLELAESPQALRERALVKRLIAAGKTKAEVKDALVAQYGRDVLATPEGSGFDLTAYVVPAVAFLLAAIALALGVRRWRRASPGPEPPGAAAANALPGEDAKRLEEDIARYDL
jgi:cytochrome c-type biogenesis protein CcmH